MRHHLLWAATLLALTGFTAAHADQDKEQPKIDDKTFVTKAAQGNLAEVALGKIAASNAQSQDVKSFAEKMMADHGKANKELATIAASKFDVPKEPNTEQKATAAKLSKLRGADFDRAYMKHMIMSHQKGVKLYQAQASSGQDAALKEFASKTLPVVKEHLKMAEELAAKEGKNGK
jgi:putative membrane protein